MDFANAANPDWDAIEKHWREGVGGAQRLLPMHVVYEYCSDVPFDPKPAFTKQPTLKKQFYNWINKLEENWFHSASELGFDFAICKGGARAGAVAAECGRDGGGGFRFGCHYGVM